MTVAALYPQPESPRPGKKSEFSRTGIRACVAFLAQKKHRHECLCYLLAFSLFAQQPEGLLTTFKSSSNLVIVNVFVRDKAGNPVEGLKKDDFKLLEDGKA